LNIEPGVIAYAFLAGCTSSLLPAWLTKMVHLHFNVVFFCYIEKKLVLLMQLCGHMHM